MQNEQQTTEVVPVTASVVPQSQPSVVLQGDPAKQLEFAKKASQALVSVINAKQKKVIINGEQYLEFEDWQTLGRFYGMSVGIEKTEAIQRDGNLFGYEAKAVVYQNGQIISGAEAMCCRDEEKWGTRAKYEWQNNQRVKVGEDNVPEFQLRSMAQTRASAKALRNVLAWVVVMAGYRPTPAEEMDGVQFNNAPKGAPSQGGYQSQGGGYAPRPASEKQIGFLKGLVRDMGYDDEWFTVKVFKHPYEKLSTTQASKYIETFKKRIADEGGKPAPVREAVIDYGADEPQDATVDPRPTPQPKPQVVGAIDYPTEEINPDDIPF